MSDIATELRCAADHVFVGTVEGARSLPIADGTFLFTQYTVMVTEGIVPGPIGGIRPGTRVTVLRPGGSMRVEEYTITAFQRRAPARDRCVVSVLREPRRGNGCVSQRSP